MRLVCVSDTHLRTDDLAVPDGDVLLHAGDLLANAATSAAHQEPERG